MASSPDRSPGAVAVTVTGEGGADEGDNGVGKDDDGDLDCAVCLQPCVHPVKLPCGHHFCFLCVKGIAFLSRKCAMCRLEIPWTCLENPELLREEDLRRSAEGGDGGANAWYYEGRNGWWQYDGRTSAELEAAFADSKEEVEVLVAGFIYVVDLVNMTQCRKNGTGRVRSVKRDLSSIPDKMGVAGLRLRDTRQQQPQQSAVPVDGGCARVGGGVGVAGAAGRPGGTGGGVPDRVRGGSSCDVPPSRNSSAPAVAVSRDDEPDCDVTSNFGRLRLDGSASSPPPPARNSRRQLLLQQQQLTQQQVQCRPGPVPDPDPDRPRPAPGARDADADGGFGDS